tara:strand:+ start:2556 stop:4097 length:1542 start_codon:yes stop_codon:yes gene_type:complete
MLGNAEPMDMGPVDLWAMTQKVEMPLYQMASFGGKNTIMVDNARGEYKWQTPVSQELPVSMGKQDAITDTAGDSRGVDGAIFKIKLSRREFGHGDIITYDKYNGLELYVTADDIIQIGDGWVYSVQLVNNSSGTGLKDVYLKMGTKFFRKGSARGEYGERFSDIQVGNGFREFYNFVGGAEAHVHYSISSRADLMLKGGMNADGTVPVTEIWRNFDTNVDPSISSIEDIASIMGKDYVKRAFDNGTLSRTFLTSMEAAHLSKIASDIETYLMWGHGGRVRQDGPDDIRLSVGLWKQLDNSYKRVYNKTAFSLDMFKNELYNFYVGKVDFDGPDPKRQLVVQTGIGGMQLVNAAIAAEANGANGMITNADNIGAITGSGMDLGFGFAYTSYIIPFLANVKFVLNPAFDNLHTNDIENPLVDGRPLSSYSFIIFDVTDEGNDNIHLLKLSWDNQLKWFYQNGTMDYMGRTQGFASSGQFNGYRVMMTQTMPAVWVKDPTKVLKIVMKNPVTGGSF